MDGAGSIRRRLRPARGPRAARLTGGPGRVRRASSKGRSGGEGPTEAGAPPRPSSSSPEPPGCARSSSSLAGFLEFAQVPLGPALLEPAGRAAGRSQLMDSVMGHDAEGPAAVGNHLAALGQLVQALLQLIDRDRPRALNVPGLELLVGADVENNDIAASHTLQELGAIDGLDLLTEVITCRALDLGQALGRGIPKCQPELQDVLACQVIADLVALPLAADQASGVQGLQVLGGIRGRLLARLGQLIDRARALGQEVK